MIGIAVVAAVWVLSTGLGALILVPVARTGLTRFEAVLYSSAVGLGVVAYGQFGLGLAGRFTPHWMLVFGALSVPPAAIGWFRLWRVRSSEPPKDSSGSDARWIAVAAGTILAVTYAAALIECFMPPGAHEWDSLSYHLAAPKAFLRAGRIVELPTDHHSYFPFLTQMLFSVGLAFDGYSAAKLIHYSFGIMSLGAAFALANRLLPRWAAWLTALIVGLAPMVVWEAGIAYIELAQTFYLTLAFHGLLRLIQTRSLRDAVTCGGISGFALSVKTLSLIPCVGFVALALWKTRCPRLAGTVALLALTIGSPFYLRTWALTGNPVYPFAFSVVGGKYWDAERARLYASEHTGFGLNASLPTLADDLRPVRAAYVAPSPADRLRNLVLAPFMLVAAPRLFHNYNDPSPHTTLGFLWLALLPLGMLAPKRNPDLAVPAMLLAFWFVTWSASMQYMRYLIPALPIAALIGAIGVIRAIRASIVPGAVLMALVGLQTAMLWVHILPRAADHARLIGSPESIERYLTRQVNVYAAQQVLNSLPNRSEGVVLFEETRGYYLDRPVLWGNSPHSAYIPYESFNNAKEMAEWFVTRGFPYALVNLQFAPQASTAEGASQLRDAVRAGREPELMLNWYGDTAEGSEKWRRLIGHAVRDEHASIVHEASLNGVVAVRFNAQDGTAP